MTFSTTHEDLLKQIDSLKKELAQCQKTGEILQYNEFKYRSLVENAAEAILVVQNDRFQFANAKAEDLFGYSQQELAANPITSFLYEEDSDMVMERKEKRLKGEQVPDVYPFRIVDKNGATIWVELKVKLFSWDGQPATLCYMTDITQRKQSEEKYRRVLESASEGFILLDCDRVINEVNKAILLISGYDRKDFVGHKMEEFYDKTTVDFYSASPEHLSFEALLRSQFGQMIPMFFSRSQLKDADGKITGYMYFLTDLTELKAAQEELKNAERRYRHMYQKALQGMFQSRLSGELIRVNPAYARILGYVSAEEVLALEEGPDRFYYSPEDRARMIRAVQTHGAVTNYELKLKRKDGKPVWILANIQIVDDGKGGAILEGILVDNTKRKILEKELRRDRKKFRELSVHDNLTGLYNTRYLYKALDQLIEESRQAQQRFSLVFMDMDNFKRVVDTYGHLNGSQALREVASTIKNHLQPPCFGIAYGGDEFVIMLPGFDKLQATKMVSEIRSRMKETSYLVRAGHNVGLQASFGIATFPDDSDNRTGLLAWADKAMFRIKQTGKDSIGITNS